MRGVAVSAALYVMLVIDLGNLYLWTRWSRPLASASLVRVL